MNTSPQCVNLMCDTETTGADPYSGILTIGLVPFLYDEPLPTFYEKCSSNSLRRLGFNFTESTMKWWETKEKAVRDEAFSGTLDVYDFLSNITEYMNSLPGPVVLWGKGSDFDNCLLRDMYNHMGDILPWDFRKNRCFRTLQELFPEIAPVYTGTKHSAIDDATNQARHATKILQHLEQLKSRA